MLYVEKKTVSAYKREGATVLNLGNTREKLFTRLLKVIAFFEAGLFSFHSKYSRKLKQIKSISSPYVLVCPTSFKPLLDLF